MCDVGWEAEWVLVLTAGVCGRARVWEVVCLFGWWRAWVGGGEAAFAEWQEIEAGGALAEVKVKKHVSEERKVLVVCRLRWVCAEYLCDVSGCVCSF